jgi:hypothetical protein
MQVQPKFLATFYCNVDSGAVTHEFHEEKKSGILNRTRRNLRRSESTFILQNNVVLNVLFARSTLLEHPPPKKFPEAWHEFPNGGFLVCLIKGVLETNK